MGEVTTIIAVVHDDGQPARCRMHKNTILFEVTEGPYQGERGCDFCLHDLVGALRRDRTQFVSFETGQKWSAGEEISLLPLFGLGDVVATPGALRALDEANQAPDVFLRRHVTGDWGDLDDHDRRANEEALRVGNRLLSAYRTKKGERIWVITEWDRSATTILLPDEY